MGIVPNANYFFSCFAAVYFPAKDRPFKEEHKEVQEANYPNIRVMNIPQNIQKNPAKDILQTTWNECSPKSIADFSAVGYFFGKELSEDLNVPIGLVSAVWGGTIIEAWTSLDELAEHKELQVAVANHDKIAREHLAYLEGLKKKIHAKMESEDGFRENKAIWADPDFNVESWKTTKLPGLWEDIGLMEFDGSIWYKKKININTDDIENGLLYLGCIDDYDQVWINGSYIGETSGWDAERIYNVPARVLNTGENDITIRVVDYYNAGGIREMHEEMRLIVNTDTLKLSGEWKYAVSPEEWKLSAIPTEPNVILSSLYNGMVAPVTNFRFKGVIWYQGESNSERACQYKFLFPGMINDWRSKFNNQDLVFLFAQIANFGAPWQQPEENDWAELREAQAVALKLPKVGMAVTIDIGEAYDVHPKNKQEVGYRLGLAAKKIAYGKELVYSGPVMKSCEIIDNRAVISFDHVGGGLVARDKYKYLKGFTVAGADSIFHFARAKIVGNNVIVQSPDVCNPIAVRYAWAGNPDDVGLYNREGLPASPFRTDNFDLCNRDVK